MLKRIISVAVLIVFFTCSTAHAQHPAQSEDPKEILDNLGVSGSVAIILRDLNSNEILYEQNARDRFKTASTAKLLTCIVALENCEPHEVVTISKRASRRGGSTLQLKREEQLSLYDMLSGMMVTSGNDAAHAVAEHVAGGQEEFAVLMNRTAQRIGMYDSHFTNSVGDSDKENYSTAYDMSLLAEYALANEQLMQMASKSSYMMPQTNLQEPREVCSTNIMFYEDSEFYYEYATGLKTGTSRKAKGSFVASAQKDGVDLVCVVMNDRSRGYTDRWRITKSMFEYGYNLYTVLNVQELLEPEKDLIVELDYGLTCGINNIEQEFLTVRKQDADIIFKTGVQHSITTHDIEFPVMRGSTVGKVTFFNKNTGIELYCAKLIATESILEKRLTFLGAINLSKPVEEALVVPDTRGISSEKDNSFIWIQLIFLGLIAVAFVVAIRVAIIKRKV